MENEYQILQDAIQKAESDIIVFFAIIAVILIAFMLPFYVIIIKDRKDQRKAESKRIELENEDRNSRQDKYMERESRIIDVITANTEVISGLRTTLEISNSATANSFTRVHERLDDQSANIASMRATQKEAVRKLSEISADIKRFFEA